MSPLSLPGSTPGHGLDDDLPDLLLMQRARQANHRNDERDERQAELQREGARVGEAVGVPEPEE
jgi:hypothetical protein